MTAGDARARVEDMRGIGTEATVTGYALSPDDAVALSPIKVGMLAFLASEVAFFGTLIDGLSLFLAPDHPGDAESEPGVSPADGPGRVGLPVLQQRDHPHGGAGAAPRRPAGFPAVGGA